MTTRKAGAVTKCSECKLSRLVVGPPENCRSLTGELLVYALDLSNEQTEGNSQHSGTAQNPPDSNPPAATVTTTTAPAETSNRRGPFDSNLITIESSQPQAPPRIRWRPELHSSNQKNLTPCHIGPPSSRRGLAFKSTKYLISRSNATRETHRVSRSRKMGNLNRRSRSLSPTLYRQQFRWKSKQIIPLLEPWGITNSTQL